MTIAQDRPQPGGPDRDVQPLPAVAQQLLQLCGQPICQLDVDGRVLAVNPPLGDLLGCDQQQVLGRRLRAWVHPEDWPRIITDLAAVPLLALRMRRGDGGWAKVMWAAARHDATVLLVGDRQPAPGGGPARRRAGGERGSWAEEIAGLGAWTCDLLRGSLHCNALVRQQLGLPGQQALSWQAVADHLHPGDREAAIAAVARAAAAAAAFEHEARVRGGDGVERTLRISARPRRDGRGEVSHFDGVSLDVSEQRRGERAMQQAVAVRDNVLASASHELRTPLTCALMHLGILERRLQQGSNPQAVRSFLGKLHHQLRRLTRLIDDIIEVSRVSSGSLSLAPVRLELRGLIEQVLAEAGGAAARARPALHCELAPAVWAFADPHRLRQALGNVLSHTIDSAPQAAVGVRLQRRGREAVIEVHDASGDVGPLERRRLLGRLERAIGRSEVSGMGLSLHISRQVLRALGGDLRVHSAPGQGACFALVLPACD